MSGPATRRIGVLTVAPSPYQRDAFLAMSRMPSWEIQVYYQEKLPPDSPWKIGPLETWEHVLPGVAPGWPSLRSHINWQVPPADAFDAWIINTALTSWSGQRLMRACVRSKVPWFFWGERLRSQASAWKSRIQDALLAPLATAHGIGAIGSWAKENYEARFPNVPVENLPYAPDVSPFHRPETGRPRSQDTDGCRFLFCGQLISRKGIDLLLSAFACLVDEGLPVELALVGRVPDGAGIHGMIPTAARGRVNLLGFEQPDALPPHFKRADAFVLPSRHDGWGVVVHQAAAAGLPLVVSDAVGSSRDLVRPGENGFIVPAGSRDALRDAMRKVATDRGLRERLGEQSRQVADRISPAGLAQCWVEFVGNRL